MEAGDRATGLTARGEAAPDEKEAVLRASNLGKTFYVNDGRTVAVDGANFSVVKGEFVSLVGASGCGKTTLLRMCAGLAAATKGSVSYQGSGHPAPAGQFGMVFQAPALLPWRTVWKNLMLPAKILGLNRERAEARARELLDLVQLTGNEDRYPSQLSGGMQQRVSIARALLHKPDLLFMDEPFGALDAMTRDDLNQQLQDIHVQSRTTILFVTHSIREAVFLSDRILVMTPSPGRIAAEFVVKFARPRAIQDQTSMAFTELEREIRSGLDHES